MYQVIKRDGRRVDFDLARIANAITKAFDAAKIPYNTAIIDLLALQVRRTMPARSGTTRSAWRIFRTAWRRCFSAPGMPP